jgi:hypothetical protein
MMPYMKNLYKSLGVDTHTSTAYCLETQGQVENNSKGLETCLCMFCAY